MGMPIFPGIVSWLTLPHPEKASSPTTDSEFGRLIVFRLPQDLKAFEPIFTRDFEKSTCVMLTHPSNADVPISRIESLRVTFFRLIAFLNAFASREADFPPAVTTAFSMP